LPLLAFACSKQFTLANSNQISMCIQPTHSADARPRALRQHQASSSVRQDGESAPDQMRGIDAATDLAVIEVTTDGDPRSAVMTVHLRGLDGASLRTTALEPLRA
jgi:hypothetical protein